MLFSRLLREHTIPAVRVFILYFLQRNGQNIFSFVVLPVPKLKFSEKTLFLREKKKAGTS